MRLLTIVTLLWTVTSLSGFAWRIKRAGGSGGKVNVKPLIKPPKRLNNKEDKHPAPGWKHCINNEKAVDRWRLIRPIPVKGQQATQFQCTWFISAVRYDGKKIQKQIQISFQKLTLGSTDNVGCKQQFVEIIDAGKSQGRFCEKERPGDYVSIGGVVRIDVQAEGGFIEWTKNGQLPFIIAYKTVPKVEPGLRFHTTKIGKNDYDPYHIGTKAVRPKKGQAPNNGIKLPKNKNDEKSVKENSLLLSVGSIIGIAVCGTLVLGIAFFVIAKRCCCAKNKENLSRDSSIREEKHFMLPQNRLIYYPCDPIIHKYPVPHSNEVIIASETVNNIKKLSKSTCDSGHDSPKSEKNSANKNEHKTPPDNMEATNTKKDQSTLNRSEAVFEARKARPERSNHKRKRLNHLKKREQQEKENDSDDTPTPPSRAPKPERKSRKSKSPSKVTKKATSLRDKKRKRSSKTNNIESANTQKVTRRKKSTERKRKKSTPHNKENESATTTNKNIPSNKRNKDNVVYKTADKQAKESHRNNSLTNENNNDEAKTAKKSKSPSDTKHKTLVRTKMRDKTASSKRKSPHTREKERTSSRKSAPTPSTRYKRKSKKSNSKN